MGAMEWMVMYIILLNITSNKGCGVWATTIECQNAFVSFQCCALCGGQNIRDYEWYKVQTHVLKVRSVHSIHSLWMSKRLATCMQCMCNNNLEIRIAGSSCHPWLSFIQIQTCQYILANSFWVKLINAWDFRPVMTGVSENVPATSAHFQQFSEHFQTLPKNVWSCSDNLWEILKLFQVSKGNWIEFLSY